MRRTAVLLSVGAVLLVLFVGTSSKVLAYFGGSPVLSSASSIDLQKGLVGWWKFDGNGKDSSPYANNATSLTNITPTVDRKGGVRGAYSYNGTGTNGFQVPNSTSLDIGSKITIAGWVKYTTGAMGVYQVLLSKVDLPNSAYELNKSNINVLRMEVVCADGTSHRFSEASASLTATNVWYHVAATFDASTGDGTVYINGQMRPVNYIDTHAACSGQIRTNPGPLNIGSRSWAGSSNSYSDIDDVRIYNRVLSATEVSALNKTYDGSAKVAYGEKDLLGHWKFDNGGIKDASPYARATVAVNGPSATNDRKLAANSAYSFNGTNQYLTTSLVQSSVTAFSVSAWVKTTTGADGQVIWQNRGPAGMGYRGLTLYMGRGNGVYGCAGCVSFTMNTDYVIAGVTSTTTVNDGIWHHIAGTWQGVAGYPVTAAQFAVYIDGQQVTTTNQAFGSVNAPLTGHPSGGFIGYDQAWNGYYDGSLDDLRVYGRMLSSSEIAAQAKRYNSQVSVGNLQKGLVGYWPLNGNAKDASPHGAHASTGGSVALAADRKGIASSAYNFTTASDSIVIPHHANLNQPADVSISLWVSPATHGAFVNGAANILQKRLLSNNVPYCLLLSQSNAVQFIWASSSQGWVMVNSSTNLSLNAWHHIVATRTASSSYIYIDGVLASGVGPGTTDAIANTLPLNLGGATSQYSAFPGYMDELRIYNRALSPSEIAKLYREYR